MQAKKYVSRINHPWLNLFLITSFSLSLLGVLFVFESSLVESLKTFGDQYFILKQHLVGLALGLVGFLSLVKLPPKWWLKLAPVAYILSLMLLILTFFPGIGLKLNGAHRWISLGPMRFQPVEALKLSLVLMLGYQLPRFSSEKKRLVNFLFYLSLPAIIILLQPDLGSLLLIGFIAVVVYFLAGGSGKSLSLLTLATIPLILIAIVLAPYRLKRLTTFINPDQDPLGASFHIRQLHLALGRGGWFGVGVGNSTQKYAYVPEAATDSIFAIVGEEVGFVGSSLIILLYLLFFISGFKLIELSQAKVKEKLVGFGFLTIILSQTFFNLGAVVGLIPLTGMPLPFFSYGRSSQIMIWLALAYLVSLHLDKNQKKVKLKSRKK